MEIVSFSWIDYALFFSMCAISMLIGIYFGCFGSKQSTISEYLLGGKSMKVFPIAMSLIASNLSGIALLGIPAEIYVYGTQYWACIICNLTVTIALIYVYLPVFYKLQLTSSFEYLKLRFDDRVKFLTTILFILSTFLYVPIVIYIPVMAFNQVSGINIHYLAPILCIICIFYTTLGGLKAVVWTDTFQMVIILLTMGAVFILDISHLDGVGTVWRNAEESGRIEFFNFSLDPTERLTFWGVSIGMSILWVAHCAINQSCIQRYLALPSIEAARKSAIYFGIGIVVTKSLSCFSGLIMYTKYKDCDPISSGQVQKMDQILPFYVLDIAKDIPGLSGVFISGVVSAALSTMSTSLNTLAGVIFEDFLVPLKRFNFNEDNSGVTLRVLVVVLGAICVGLVFFVEKLKGVIQICMSFSGITGGPLMGVFTLGMLCPSANSVGTFWGIVISLVFVTIMCTGQQIHQMLGHLKYPTKPFSLIACTNLTTHLKRTTAEQVEPFWLFKISFCWFAFIGFTVMVLFSLLISYLSRRDEKKKVNRDLLSPCIYKFLGESYGSGKIKEYDLASQLDAQVNKDKACNCTI